MSVGIKEARKKIQRSIEYLAGHDRQDKVEVELRHVLATALNHLREKTGRDLIIVDATDAEASTEEPFNQLAAAYEHDQGDSYNDDSPAD